MSVAEVTASGPFSRFEGITRWFAVLKGDGVALTVRTPSDSDDAGDCEHRLSATDPALCFDGGASTHCALLGGPTQDFNLMVLDDCLPARMVRVQGDLTVLAGASKTIAVYAVDSGASVRFNAEDIFLPAGTLVWRTLTKRPPCISTAHTSCGWNCQHDSADLDELQRRTMAPNADPAYGWWKMPRWWWRGTRWCGWAHKCLAG